MIFSLQIAEGKMKKKFLNSTMHLITSSKKYNKEEQEQLLYGLEGIYLTLSKTVIIFLLAIILGIGKEVLITLVLFNLIRFTGFGFHAEKSYQCLIISIFNFILIPFFLIHVYIGKEITFILSILCVFTYLLFAPADTLKRPLPNKKKRTIRKIGTIMIGTIYTVFILVFPKSFMAPLFLSALIIESLIINPLTYKLFKQPYNNYKNYIPA